MNVSRRHCLQVGGVGWTGLTLPALLAAAEPPTSSPLRARARSCILLFLDGGPSHIDLFDRRPQATADIRGPFQSIATSVPGLDVCEHLPRVARRLHHFLQVRSLRHTETVHDPAVYQMLTGYKHVSSAGGLRVEETDRPHLGSALAMADSRRSPLPAFIQAPDKMKMEGRVLPGQGAGVLPASFEPLEVQVTMSGEVIPPAFARYAAAAPERLQERWQLLDQLETFAPFSSAASGAGPDAVVDAVGASPRSDRQGQAAANSRERLARFRQQAFDLALSPAARAAFDVEQEPATIRDRYGRHRQGQSALLARRLVEAGSRLVTVYWGHEPQDWADGRGPRLANNPWDTHRNHFPLCRESLLPRADQTLSALIDDLHERGLLDETLVVWMGEFGRTPYISRPWASRDHWPHAFTALLAGAGVRGGTVYGRTDRLAAEVVDAPVTPADLAATLFDALGVPPDTRLPSLRGGFHQLATGRVIHEWFAT